MGKVIVVTNRKGGCGKSTTCVNLGIGLAKQGKRVLIIDADSQRSLSISLGVKEPEKLPVTLYTVMENIVNTMTQGIVAEKEIDTVAGIIHHSEGIDLMPASNRLAGIEIILAPLYGREIILKQYVDKIKPLYDYCLIDTAPSLDLMAVNALAAADSVIIPVIPLYSDAMGLELLLRTVSNIRQQINPNLTIDGILLTMVDTRTNFTRGMISSIESAYGRNIRIFGEYIPRSIRAAEPTAKGISIFSHEPDGKVAAAYAALTREVMADVA